MGAFTLAPTGVSQVGAGTTISDALAGASTAGNLIIAVYGGRQNAGTALVDWSLGGAGGWSDSNEICRASEFGSGMEFHDIGIAWKAAAETTEAFELTYSESSNSRWCAVMEWEQSGVSSWKVDKFSGNGTGASNASSIQASIGPMTSSVGLALVVGTSRTGTEDLSLSVLASLGSGNVMELDGGSANYICGFLDLSATTAITETVSEAVGSSRMGIALVAFVEDAGGTTTTTTTTSTTTTTTTTAGSASPAPPGRVFNRSTDRAMRGPMAWKKSNTGSGLYLPRRSSMLVPIRLA